VTIQESIRTALEEEGVSQTELARRLETSQPAVSRTVSPNYRGHSMRMIRRVADALGRELRVELIPKEEV